MSDAPRTILVYVGLDLLGDGLIKLPFVRALRAAFPEARITWCAGKGKSVYASILTPLVKGLIDEVIEEAGVTGKEWLPGRRAPLPGRHFDMVIDTQRRVQTALSVACIENDIFVSGALGWWLSDRKPRNRAKPDAMIDQLLALVVAASGTVPQIDAAPLPVDPLAAEDAKRALPDGPAYIGLAPGAGGQDKQWPLDRYLSLAQRIARAGHVPAILLGPYEQSWAQKIRETVPEAILPLPGDVSPVQTIAVARRLAAAVANDSGTGHLIAAADTPLVSLFGPTRPEKFAPTASRLVVVRAQDFGGDTMDAIPVDAVEKALATLLKK